MEAHKFIRETFELNNKISINELPNLPVSLVVELLNNFAEDKVKKLPIPDVNGWRLFQNEAPPLNKDIEVAKLGYPIKRKITIAELQFYEWNNYCWREV